MHIPKTGGTTLTHVIRKQYAPTEHFAFTGDADADARRYQALSTAARERIALFTGHAPLITGLERADRSAIITVLREPISRVKSFCMHVAEGKSPHLFTQFAPTSFSLDEFLWSGNGELSNLQTKMLINRHHCAAAWGPDLSDDSAVELALSNLFHRITFYGIQAHLRASVSQLEAVFGWQKARYTSRNVARTGRTLVFQRHHIQRIIELNGIDLEVYRVAESRFLRNHHHATSRLSAVAAAAAPAGM